MTQSETSGPGPESTPATVARLRSDLETINAVVGPALPFTRGDAAGNLILVAGGAAMIVLALRLPSVLIRLSALPVLAAGIYCVLHPTNPLAPPAIAAAQRREWKFSWQMAALTGGFAAAYLFFHRSGGIDFRGIMGAVLFFVGVACAVVCLTGRQRLNYLGCALPLMAWGLLAPGSSLRQIAAEGGAACAACGLLCMLIELWQLRRQDRP